MLGNCIPVSHPLLQAGLFSRCVFPIRHVSADGQGFLQRRLTVQSGVAHVLIDGVDGHLRYVFSGFGLDVQRDQTIRYQVVNGLEALLPNKMLPIVKQTEVSGLVPKSEREKETMRNLSAVTHSCETIHREKRSCTHTHTEHLWMYQLPVLWFLVVMRLESKELIC